MGRRAQGHKIIKRGRLYYVRFTHEGRRHEYGTGESTRTEADRVGHALWLAVLRGEQLDTGRGPAAGPTERPSGTPLEEVTREWLSDHPIRKSTLVLYGKYAGYWAKAFATTGELTSQAVAAYCRSRLQKARGKTVGSEMSALRAFVGWLVETDRLAAPPEVPTVTRQVAGTPYRHRRRSRAPEINPADVERILELLPEKSARGWWVRPRFVVAYDTTLRPETLDKLSVPENWSPGSNELSLSAEDDKELYGRAIPLTQRAIRELERVAPEAGLIFGQHRAGPYLKEAARKVLPESKAAIFTGQHFRSAAITHLLELTGNLPGVQGLAGHLHTSTTSKYVRPTLRAARSVVAEAESKRVILVKIPVKAGTSG